MKKLLAVFFVLLLPVVLTLAVLGVLSWLYFWLLAIAGAFVAFKVLPRMK